MSEGIKIERDALCPECNHPVAVTKRGTFKLHTRTRAHGWSSVRRRCDGSAMPVPPGAVAERMRRREENTRRAAEWERGKAAALRAEADTHEAAAAAREALAEAYAAALAKESDDE